MLNQDQRTLLLHIARQSIEGALGGQHFKLDVAAFDETLRRPAGAFVTLRTQRGDLRGCIGSIVAMEPLFRAVATSAVSAACRDPRFIPVAMTELPQLGLEISVMGPIELVRNVDEIVC